MSNPPEMISVGYLNNNNILNIFATISITTCVILFAINGATVDSIENNWILITSFIPISLLVFYGIYKILKQLFSSPSPPLMSKPSMLSIPNFVPKWFKTPMPSISKPSMSSIPKPSMSSIPKLPMLSMSYISEVVSKIIEHFKHPLNFRKFWFILAIMLCLVVIIFKIYIIVSMVPYIR